MIASSPLCRWLLIVLLWGLTIIASEPPSARALIERFNREKSPVWSDGETATFFFRGGAQSVELIAGGDFKSLVRIPSSDVWTVAITLPDLERAVISYQLTAKREGRPADQHSRETGVWRGAKAPSAPVEAGRLKGSLRSLEIDSQAFGSRRKLTVYSPPEHEAGKADRVVYAGDGEGIDRYARVLEPLIISRKLPPIAIVGVHSAGYLGGARDFQNYDAKKDLRAQEYFPGINPERFVRHETFFCSEVTSWAERELKVSQLSRDRVLFGSSNGGRFAIEMAMRHPDQFGFILGFSVPGGGPITLPDRYTTQAEFYLEAGTWEPVFHLYTSRIAERLKQAGVRAEFQSRVGGHDEAIWREEFINGLRRAFGSG